MKAAQWHFDVVFRFPVSKNTNFSVLFGPYSHQANLNGDKLVLFHALLYFPNLMDQMTQIMTVKLVISLNCHQVHLFRHGPEFTKKCELFS